MDNLDSVPSSDPAGTVHRPRLSVFQLVLLFEGGLAVAACVAGLFMDLPPWQQIEWHWKQVGIGIAATVPMVLGLLVIRRAQVGPLARLNNVVDELLVPLFADCTSAQLAGIAAMAGIGEELLFRGVLQPLLVEFLGSVAGIAITSFVFGLLHAVTTTYAVLAFAVSVYLGWLAMATDGITGAIIAHALYDFFALLYLTRRKRGLVVQ
ncbi:MAG: CPBP family intramembrane metalloprotease [Pirellulales bacterium]|nr:CPBP family intramembrane metalloprotease [Pirellulales bacterium]